MSAGGSISAMISSIKSNTRRKDKHAPFSDTVIKYKKGKPLQSKKFTQLEKDILTEELKENRTMENKQRVYKLIISLGLTIIFMLGFISILKFTFFQHNMTFSLKSITFADQIYR